VVVTVDNHQIWEDKIIERVKKPGFFTDQEELNFLFEVGA
jgi:hypothetical protein